MANERSIHERFWSLYWKVQNPSKDAENPFFDSRYATLETLVNQIKPLAQEEGLMLIQQNIADDLGVGVRTYFEDALGERKDFGAFTVPVSKRDPQGAGSAFTYCRRYALKSIFGLVEIDDDGEAASEHALMESLLNAFEKMFATASEDPEAKKGAAVMLGSPTNKGEARNAWCAMTDEQRAQVVAVANGAPVPDIEW